MSDCPVRIVDRRPRVTVPPPTAAVTVRAPGAAVRLEDREPTVVEVPKGRPGDKGEQGVPGPANQWASLEW